MTDPVAVGLRLGAAALLADPSGALLWPERHLLVVADLHLEKGSAYAARGQLLPPYDTRVTLALLAHVIDRYRPRTVVCLGDSFHDRGAAERVSAADSTCLRRLTAACDWLWVAGNHDSVPPTQWGGRIEAEVTVAGLSFRHQARVGAEAEVSGHFHPVAVVRTRLRRVRGRCFAAGRDRLVLPAFGAYTGGLNVLDPALRPLFGPPLQVLLLGRDRLFPVASELLEGDAFPVSLPRSGRS